MRKMILMENLSFQTFLPLHLLEQKKHEDKQMIGVIFIDK